jgi:micrococcal nuclease
MRYLFILMSALLFSAMAQDTNVVQAQPLGIAKIVKVYDGDTFYADLYNLPDIFAKNIGIRLIGIDTPELTGGDSCSKAMAKAARTFLDKTLKAACKIELRNISRDKYFRVDAVVFADSINVNALMIEKGYAKAYTGEGPKPIHPCIK